MPDRTSISVADNDPDILEVISIIFSDRPEYRFKYFLSGRDLVRSLDDKEYLDLVILDVHMESGFNVVEAVQIIDSLVPMAYIIILSGDKDPNKLIDFLELGVFRFVEKGTNSFVRKLEEAVKAAHRKITIRKGLLEDGIQ